MNEHWAKRLFQWGISENIINGYSNYSSKPDQVITEAEFLKMLYRAMSMAIPNASANSAYLPSESWTEGLYRVAKRYNHPTTGENNFAMRMQSITKLRAAEIISATQGVHYTGQYAVAYLIVHGLPTVKLIFQSSLMRKVHLRGQKHFNGYASLLFMEDLRSMKDQKFLQISVFFLI
ncbi:MULTISPECIES: S-layer homology domain-containing protein [unclassified Paenibacillus]|uniref:S-layer homology domain-containing protein n=1 Tax=unclassified Paenibacillus TaxID=185978 RepID=UPI0008CB1ECB|nr:MULTISPECIES: S-layer homology domain-containing protein [unclassified Paenibacillus]QLG40377.1 S-layer homology domain-containing protein [Paenibacillus sp. E222]SEN72660.1 hypothetical protein SAMN05518670_2538 [Paenibacillus sp. OK076]